MFMITTFWFSRHKSQHWFSFCFVVLALLFLHIFGELLPNNDADNARNRTWCNRIQGWANENSQRNNLYRRKKEQKNESIKNNLVLEFFLWSFEWFFRFDQNLTLWTFLASRRLHQKYLKDSRLMKNYILRAEIPLQPDPINCQPIFHHRVS